MGAALGVAFASAILSLGVSLGLDFTKAKDAPAGPDLLEIIKNLNRDEVPEDVRDEAFESISDIERPKAGDWFAIWGGRFFPNYSPTKTD